MALTGAQARELTVALLDAFRDRSQLKNMLRFECDVRLDEIVQDKRLDQVVADVVDEAERGGWAGKLIEGAIRDNPGNPVLKAYYERNWLVVGLPPTRRLESMVSAGDFFDLEPWIARVIEIGRQVCRISVFATPRAVYGTGFLVGPSLVLTNHHVMEPVILGDRGQATVSGLKATTAQVEFRFDYKMLRGNVGINDGTVHRLAGSSVDDWLAAESRPSPLDEEPVAGQDPPADELDVVLVRLAGSPGQDAVREDPGGGPRGWIDVPDRPHTLAPGDGLLVVQHPDRDTIKLDLRDKAVVSVNGHGTRVTYNNNTLGGSSGSPCFRLTQQLPLVAVHHLGDPNFSAPSQNQGIPMTAIRAWLEAEGLSSLLSSAGGAGRP